MWIYLFIRHCAFCICRGCFLSLHTAVGLLFCSLQPLKLHLDIGYVPPTDTGSLWLAVDSTHTAVGHFRLLVRRSGTHCQMNSEIRRVMSFMSPGLPCPPTPVGPERCGATGIPSPPIWPHHGCTRQPPLAASVRKDYFQGRRSDLPGSTWRCPAVLTTVHIDRRHPVPTKIAVFNFRRAMCSCC